jgi:hypothetical protein
MFPPLPLPSTAGSGGPPANRSPAVAIYNPQRRGQVTAWPTGVWVNVLASGFGGTATGVCLAAPLALTITRFALAPDATLPAGSVTGVALLARGDVWLVDAFPTGTPVSLPGVPAMAEQGLASADGRLPAVRNLSAQPLPLVLFAAAPLPTPSCRPAGLASVASPDAAPETRRQDDRFPKPPFPARSQCRPDCGIGTGNGP